MFAFLLFLNENVVVGEVLPEGLSLSYVHERLHKFFTSVEIVVFANVALTSCLRLFFEASLHFKIINESILTVQLGFEAAQPIKISNKTS